MAGFGCGPEKLVALSVIADASRGFFDKRDQPARAAGVDVAWSGRNGVTELPELGGNVWGERGAGSVERKGR